MRRNRTIIKESDLHKIVKESVKRVIKESYYPDVNEKWDELLSTVGAETMLDCLFTWASIDQKEQWLDWFEEEGYADWSEDEEEDY